VDIKDIGEDDLYMDVEVVRGDNGLCGKNATYYRPRITQEIKRT
jgi:hypothetical protein